MLTIWGMLYCGLFPAAYGTEYAAGQILNKPYFAVFAAVVLMILAVYALCRLFFKNKIGWLIVALLLRYGRHSFRQTRYRRKQ